MRFYRWCGTVIIGILTLIWPDDWREEIVMTNPFDDADWAELAARIARLCERVNAVSAGDNPTQQDVDDLGIANDLMRRLWEEIRPVADAAQKELGDGYVTDAGIWQAIVESSFEAAQEECGGSG